MISWLISNLATIIICAVLIGIVTLIIISMVRKKKSGKSSCCGSCSHCSMGGSCHHN